MAAVYTNGDSYPPIIAGLLRIDSAAICVLLLKLELSMNRTTFPIMCIDCDFTSLFVFIFGIYASFFRPMLTAADLWHLPNVCD